jgi:hypothetical protein
MMYVNLASAHRHIGSEEHCLRILSGVDWSGASDDFKVCVAALRGDVQGVTGLMGLITNSGKITKYAFRNWPVFDFIRDNEAFLTKFMEIFGEPLRNEEQPAAIEFSEVGTESPAITDTVTVH